MLPQANRLTKKKDFERIFKEGRSSYDKLLGIKISPNRMDVSRFGILVGSKISKKAVERNLIKRRIRESIKKKLLHIKTGFDLIVITLPPIKKSEFDEIESALEFNLKRLKILS
jgi:ribonuclease P protein component